MRRALFTGFAATVLLAGCGEAGGSAQQPSAQSSTPTTSATTPAVTTSAVTAATKTLPVPGTLAVSQAGTQPARTLWYMRIESMAAEPLFERNYPGHPIAQSRILEPGEYRVIAWHRSCSGTCPSSGEAGLGALEQLCGAKITITPRTRTAVTVAIDSEGTCAMKVT